MYDIYLSSGCHTLPDLGNLASDFSVLNDPALQSRLLERQPGFLGFDLAKNDAVALLKQLKTVWARGGIVLAKYRHSKVSLQEAFPIAERIIAKLQAEHLPDISFGPVQFRSEDAMWWKFGATSEELIEQGYIPGALYAYVDKLDGHVWQPEEMERLFEEHERLCKQPDSEERTVKSIKLDKMLSH